MSKIRVFLVEDNETISANLIAIIHELTNVEVIGVARTEEQAVGWMSKNTADVYIIDVMLKSGDGLSILKQININKGIWIIFSNYTVPNLVKMTKDLGANYVLNKSNEIDTLLNLLGQFASRIK